jgi:nucleotide-binding universal stress UspA family protein
MNRSILVVLNDTPCSKLALEFLAQCPLSFPEVRITILHVFRKPSGSEEMMGKKFLKSQKERVDKAMANARQRLIEAGYPPDNVRTHIATQPYPTVADGIIAKVNKDNHDIVVIGRKNMSKSEEFVMGDASIRLLRALEKAAVIVVKCRNRASQWLAFMQRTARPVLT